MAPHSSSCLEKPRGQRSLVGHSLWGLKESDRTEHLKHIQYTHLKTLWETTFASDVHLKCEMVTVICY